ncbi:MAG: DUF4212 domain-containing protein [Proteobacteria bacterium]|nr:DUF4212 domain-containing protein [Pseudomonadota bacterium]
MHEHPAERLWAECRSVVTGLLPRQNLRKLLLTLLAAWIGYFVLINAFVRMLNTVDVPWLGMPLGIFLPIQGAIIVFIVLLHGLARPRHDGGAA